MATYGSAEWAQQHYKSNYYKPPASAHTPPKVQPYGGYQPPSYYSLYDDYLKKLALQQEAQAAQAAQTRSQQEAQARAQWEAQQQEINRRHAGFGRQFTRTQEQVANERPAASNLGKPPATTTWQQFYNQYYGGGVNIPTFANTLVYGQLNPFQPSITQIRPTPNFAPGASWVDQFRDLPRVTVGASLNQNQNFKPGTWKDSRQVELVPPDVLGDTPPAPDFGGYPDGVGQYPDFPDWGGGGWGGYGGGGYSYPKYSQSQDASKWYQTMVQWNIGNK